MERFFGTCIIFLFLFSIVSSQCPVELSGDPCSNSAAPMVVLDFANYGSNMACQVVDIRSPNYPNPYGAGICEWKIGISNAGGSVAFAVDVIDFLSESGDTLEVAFVSGSTEAASEFSGDSDQFLAEYPDPRTKAITTTTVTNVDSVVIRFTTAEGAFNATGFHLELLVARNDICDGPTSPGAHVLSADYPVAVYATRNFPNDYDVTEQCFTEISSPNGTAVHVHYVDLAFQVLQDFFFIFDTSVPSMPTILRVISTAALTGSPTDFTSRSDRLQFVFDNNPNKNRMGAMIKISYMDATRVDCSDHGTVVESCVCPDTLNNPSSTCAVDTSDGFVDITSQTADTTCNGKLSPYEQVLSYTEAGSYKSAATAGYYDPGVYNDTVDCYWAYVAPVGAELYIIIRDFQVDGVRDRFQFIPKGSNGRIFRYTGDGSSTSVLYSDGTAGVDFEIVDALILGADDEMKVEFTTNDVDDTVGKGVLYEIRVVDPACEYPCINGGFCAQTCHCDIGYQGDQCEQQVSVEIRGGGSFIEGTDAYFDLQCRTNVDVIQDTVVTFQLHPDTTASEGYDFPPLSPYTCIILANTDRTDVFIPLINDTLSEPGPRELIVVTIGAVTGQPSIDPTSFVTVRITEDVLDTDLIQVNFNAEIYNVYEENVETTASLTILFTDPQGNPAPVEEDAVIHFIFPEDSGAGLDTAENGVDYQQNLTINVVAGTLATYVVHELVIYPDEVAESVETFRILLTEITGTDRMEITPGQATSTVLIHDEDTMDFVAVVNQPRIPRRGKRPLKLYAVYTQPSYALVMDPPYSSVPMTSRQLRINGNFYGHYYNIPKPRANPFRRFGTYRFTHGTGNGAKVVNAHIGVTSDQLVYNGPYTVTVYPDYQGSPNLDRTTDLSVEYDGAAGTIRWKRGRVILDNKGRSVRRLTTTENVAGIYEVTRKLRSGFYIEVILSDCPRGFYKDEGGSCTLACPECYNGGVCEADTGRCTCPPCFLGKNCELVQSDPHTFGQSAPIACKDLPGISSGNCNGMEFCYGGLYGCSCGCGYTGLNCRKRCSLGTFGPGCTQTCHCIGGCNRFTGQCFNKCLPEYEGETCQILKSIT